MRYGKAPRSLAAAHEPRDHGRARILSSSCGYVCYFTELGLITRLHHGLTDHLKLDAVALARQCDLPEILPAIFYSLAVDYTHTHVLPGRLSEPGDQRRLIAGVARLDAFLANTQQCVQALGCCERCRASIRERWKMLLGGAWTLHAMYWQWAEAVDEEAWDGFCMDCFCSYESFLDMTRTRLRDAIPGFFGL